MFSCTGSIRGRGGRLSMVRGVAKAQSQVPQPLWLAGWLAGWLSVYVSRAVRAVAYLLPGGLRVALPTPRAGQARCGLLLCMPAGGATGASDSVQSRLPAVVPPAGTGQGPEKGRGSPKQGFAARRPEERPETNLSPVQGGDNCTHCIVLHLALACSRSAPPCTAACPGRACLALRTQCVQTIRP